MQAKNENINKKAIILTSIITSLIISFLMIGGIGYYIYYKYLSRDRLQELISAHLEEYVESGDLKALIVAKIEQHTGGKATIEEISIDAKDGIFLKNIKILKGNDTISIKDGNATITDGIILNEIIRTGGTEADRIMVSSAQVDLNNITLNEVAINPSSEITVKNPRFIAEKVVIGYNALDFLSGKFLIKSFTSLSSELSLIRRKDGIWLIMTALKNLIDNFNLPEYTEFLSNGAVFKNGALHFIDKDFFPGGALDVSGIDMVIKPFSGSLKNLRINSVVHDNFFGNYNVTGEMDLNIPALNIKLNAEDIAISEDFVRAIPAIGENIWNSYKPVGKLELDGLLTFDNGNGKRKFDRQIEINFNEIETTYHHWPIKVSRVTGSLMLTNNKISIENLLGYVFQNGQHGTRIECDAILEIGKLDKKVSVNAKDINVTTELVKKMPDLCKRLFHTLKPSGHADMDLIYSANDDGTINNDYKIELNCKDWELTYPEIPVPLKGINGQVVITNRAKKSMLGEHAGIVQIKDMEGYFSDGQQITAFSFDGEFDMKSPKKLFYLNAPGFNLSKDILKNLPERYKNITKDFTPKGQIDLDVIYDHRNLDTKPDISITMNCKGCNFKDSKLPIPLEGVMGVVKVEGNKVSADNISGLCHGGQVNGRVHIDIQDSSYKYNGNFSFSEINMEELFRNFFKINQKWQGLLNGKITFNRGGEGEEKKDNDLIAKGNIIFNEGNISDVPIALSVINILNFGIPAKVIFKSGYINFSVKDDIIIIEEAKIYSDTIELAARGNVSFEGNLDITTILGFSKSTLRDIPLVGPLVDFVVGGVRKQLTKVHLGGTIANPESTLTVLNPIKGPIKSVVELIPMNSEKHGTATAVPDK